MDTSETYIKMCEKAERTAPELFYKSSYDIHDYTFKVEGNDLLWWLPRQDQLQEMVRDRLFHIWGGFKPFKGHHKGLFMTASTGNRDSHQVCEGVTSMEQLWLAFVMKEKFNKTWNGESWVKAS